MNSETLNYRLKTAIGIGFVLGTIGFFTFVVSSLIAILLIFCVALVGLKWHQLARRDEAIAVNEALRAVCDRDASVIGLLGAAAIRGRLRSECYHFAYRMKCGQDPVEAAVASKMPLEIATAVALRAQKTDTAKQRRQKKEFAIMDELTSEPVIRGQQLYLTVTLLACSLLLSFSATMLVPTMEKMLEEFEQEPIFNFSDSFQRVGPGVLGIVLVVWIATPLLMKFSQISGLGRSNSLSYSIKKADVLSGVAEAIRRNVPVVDALDIGARLTRGSAKSSIVRASRLVRSGRRPADSFAAVGWITKSQRNRLAASQADRAAELLDHISQQHVRDAMYRLRWWITFSHPILIFLVGLFVASFGIWIHGSLAAMIRLMSS